jgi:radical SAM superfamily enzyme YgiQ (UPF0313 family)
MRAALVNPPDTLEPDNHEEHAPEPLGLCYVAAWARQQGHDVDLYDLAERPTATFSPVERARFASYPVVGITSYTKTFESALEVAAFVKELNREAVVVLGGPHATPCAGEILRRHPEIDLIVKNDGELPFAALLGEIGGGCPCLEGVPNLVWRDPCSGAIVENPVEVTLPPLDELPFPARDFLIEPVRDTQWSRGRARAQSVCVVSSRGCPKRCTFCSIIVMNPRWRARSVANIMAELRLLRETRPFEHVTFVDANFFVYSRRAAEFSDALYAWDPTVTWSGTATADHVARHPREIAGISKNCASLEIGLESGSNSVLSRYGKKTTVEQNLDAIRILRRHGIEIEVDFIMYDPWTTLDELRESRRFLDEADLVGYWPADLLFNPLKLYPGTAAQQQAVAAFGLADRRHTELLAPFADRRTEYVYRAMTAYRRRYQLAIEEVAPALEADLKQQLVARPVGAARRAQAGFRTVIGLRHAAYAVFDEVLDAARNPASAPPRALDIPAVGRAAELLASATDELQRSDLLVTGGSVR